MAAPRRVLRPSLLPLALASFLNLALRSWHSLPAVALGVRRATSGTPDAARRRSSCCHLRPIIAAPRSVLKAAGPGEKNQRDSYSTSPAWTKSVVSGLTALINGFSGEESPEPARVRKFESISPEQLFDGIRSDFVDRQYLWSGDIDAELYDENCTFTDPTLSFTGLSTFETNIRNLRPILDTFIPERNRQCVLHHLERKDSGVVVADWMMIGDLSLPWRPRIELGGRTTYTPGPDGRIVSYFERWDLSAAEALFQILQPRVAVESLPPEHWPGRLEGAPPPEPRVQLAAATPPVLAVLPGFGNDEVDYFSPLGQNESVGLVACLARRGCKAIVSPVKRWDWLQVFFFGFLDEDFRAGNGSTFVAFGWYLDRARRLVEEATASSGPVVLVGHSAGGWLARALMQREGLDWVKKHLRGLVTLGAPHRPPPDGRFDMTMGCLRNLHKEQPGAFFSEHVFYITVAGDAIVGEQIKGNLPILELVQSPSTESTAFNSYRAVCGRGNVTGDGVVPLVSAHLDGAQQLTLKGCSHSINVVGTTNPTDSSYLCERFVDDWMQLLAEGLEN